MCNLTQAFVSNQLRFAQNSETSDTKCEADHGETSFAECR
jgi:hypothetical protein